MLVSIPVDLTSFKNCRRSLVSSQYVHDILTKHYEGQTAVRLMPFEKTLSYADGRLALDGLAGKDQMELFVVPYENCKASLLVARLDNLGKGASGAAVQNMNLMLGL